MDFVRERSDDKARKCDCINITRFCPCDVMRAAWIISPREKCLHAKVNAVHEGSLIEKSPRLLINDRDIY